MENQQPNQEAPDHVLVVDDDAEIRTLLAEYLSQNGIRVTVARDATEMRQVFDEARPDIIILDLMMPGEDGLTVCRELRSRSNVPVIMLTARADSGARHLISPDNVIVPLSGAEYRLLSVLIQHPNRVLDRNQLMDLTLGREATPFDRSIDVQISRLRNRLNDDAREPRIIKTIRNEGYILAAHVERVG